MIGNLTRIVLVVGWLGLLGFHISRHLLPQLGLAPAQDAGAILATRLDRGLTYELRWTPSGRPTVAVGTCRISAVRDDVGFRTSNDIQITDLRFVPGLEALRKLMPGTSRKGGVRLRIDELLDANYRLHRIEASGSLLGLAFHAEGPVDHRGLDLTWGITGGPGGRNLLAEVRPDRVAGGELNIGLPAGLKPGASFTSRIMSPDPTRMTAGVKTAVFRVGARERTETAGGAMELMRVEMQVDGRETATLWSGDDGTVYRQLMHDGGLELSLTAIDNNLKERLWPAP